MSHIALLFPGQGSQFEGMGQSLADEYPAAASAFKEADEALGYSISKLCFEGPEEELQKTENTQPALLTVSIAAYRVLKELGISGSMVAGHSLGEFSALVAAGSLKFADAVRLVKKRGRYMQEAVPHGVGAMAALLKLPENELETILQQAAQGEVLSAANFNSPDQVVIAGHVGAVERAMELAKPRAKRVVRLPVSAPFHCALMKPAQERMAPELDSVIFEDLQLPLVNNWQAVEVRTGQEAKAGLLEMIPNAVRWTEVIRNLSGAGITGFIEVGPGNVLSGLCRSIEPNWRGARFGEATDVEKVQALFAQHAAR